MKVESVAHSKLPSGRAASEVAVTKGLSEEDNAGLPPQISKPVIDLSAFFPVMACDGHRLVKHFGNADGL